MKETMTVHKALSELKTLNSRIQREIDGTMFVCPNKHSNTKLNGIPVSEFVNSAKDAYKSIVSLINRRNAIKQAVVRSNALTKVTVGGKEYTVAEAIDAKANGMELYRSLAGVISSQMTAAKRAVDRENGDKLDLRADTYVKSLYENADMKNLADDVKKVREDFIASQMLDIIDPIKADETVKKLNSEIDAFMTDIDSALSVSNALTTIEIEYETL